MSSKPSTQQGRRTPLSLSGAVTKSNPSKSGNTSNGGGSSANGHTSSNTCKQDNKLQQQKYETQIVNNSDPKRQQPQGEKKQQQNDNKKPNEKSQNGLNNNKQQPSIENKQQQQNKDKQQQQQQQQNGSDGNKVSEKDNNEKADKLEKQDEKSEKVDSKLKEDKKVQQDKPDNKKEEKKSKEIKDTKLDKQDGTIKNDPKIEHQSIKIDDKKSKEDNHNAGQKTEGNTENMNLSVTEHLQKNHIPVTPKSNTKVNKTSIPINKTPTKTEKTPQKLIPYNTIKTTPAASNIDNNDVEMEILLESSSIKRSNPEEVANINAAPSATSTPGKVHLPKRNSGGPNSELQLTTQIGFSPERPRAFSQISGRKSIRPISDYTPSKLQGNMHFRESYRRINTELDITNTSMNVTVGSEVPNNFSFSFFGRGRKRDRTSPHNSQLAIGEVQTDMEISPPKKARLDMHGFFTAVSSPLSLLRNRFSKASLKCSTPVLLQQKINATEDEIEVQNVSGVSVHEEITKSEKGPAKANTSVNENNEVTSGEEVKSFAVQDDSDNKVLRDNSKREITCGIEKTSEQSDIKITETFVQTAVGDPTTKNKRCMVM